MSGMPGLPGYRDAKEFWRDTRAGWRNYRLGQAHKRLKAVEPKRELPLIYQFLKWKYQGYSLLERCGETYPLAIFPVDLKDATSPQSQLWNPNSVLLSLERKRIDTRQASRAGIRYRKLLEQGGRIIQDLPTFTMHEFSNEGNLGLKCGTGSYVAMLETCDVLEWELLSRASKLDQSADKTFERFDRNLRLRTHLHEQVSDPVRSGAGRSAAISISTLVAYRSSRNAFYLWIRRRSANVAAHAGLLHVIPSFIFQPVTSYLEDEFDVLHNIFREYLEEVFGRPDSPQDETGPGYFYNDPCLVRLQRLLKTNRAQLFLSGLAVNLFNLRPEICTVLLIHDERWHDDHAQHRQPNMQFRFNELEWEKLRADNVEQIVARVPFDIAATDEDLVGHAPIHPSTMVPAGAAAFWMGVDVLRRVLG